MSQNSNILYINFLKKAGISSFLQDKPKVYYKINNNKHAQNFDKIRNLDDLNFFIKKNYKIKFHNFSNDTIISQGNETADICIIGDTPEKIKQKISPFVGESEKLLYKMLQSINLNKDQIYISNIVPWFTDKNKKIENSELIECLRFIQKRIEIIRPKIILLMGSIASKTILNSNLELNKLRGRWHDYKSFNLDKTIKCLVTYNPKDLIKFPKNKKYAWEDLKMFEKKIT